MTRTIAVVQARLGSRRFPGKMLATLGGHTLLEWVVTRVCQSTLVDRVVVATTVEPLDDQLVLECERLSVEFVRGSTDDVLGRFIDAVQGDIASEVVRVCADNPFVDGSCIDTVIREHRAAKADYSFNHRPLAACNYADGFGAEVVSREFLEALHQRQLSPGHREHVTLAIVDGTVAARVHGCVAPAALAHSDLRFDVDAPSDLGRLEVLVHSGRLTMHSSASEIVAAEFHRRASS